MGKIGESSVFCKTSTSIYFMKLIQNYVKTAQIVFEMKTVSQKEFTILFSKIILKISQLNTRVRNSLKNVGRINLQT